MHFINAYLLAGAVLAGMPVLLHLLMKQKPKVQIFPALKFLRKRMQTSRRRMQIQNWLLLLLRIMLILLLCLALAWPQIRNLGPGWAAAGEVAAVFVIDTSASMEMRAGDKKRIDVCKELVTSLRAQFGDESKLALIETAEGSESSEVAWVSVPLFDQKLGTLQARPGGEPLGPSVARALELIRKDQSLGGLGKAVYIFTDRANRSWESFSSSVRPESVPEGVQIHLIDVGLEKPVDFAIERVDLEPTVVAPGDKVTVRVELRATGETFKGQLSCALEHDPEPGKKPDVKSLEIPANETRSVVFEKNAPIRGAGNGAENLGQVQLKLLPEDNWSVNNKGQATFVVHEKRKVLTLVDQMDDALIWRTALEAMRNYACDVRFGSNPKEWTEEALKPYQVICLLEMASPSAELWKALGAAEKSGKGIVIIPPGENLSKASWDSPAAKEILPAPFTEQVTMPAGAPGLSWGEFRGDTVLSRVFRLLSRSVDADFSRPERWPFANRFWKVGQLEPNAAVVTSFSAYKDAVHPSLLERQNAKGKVIQFTTPFSGKKFDGDRKWHNYGDSSFPLVLVDQVCRYLSGDATSAIGSFYAGQLPYFNMPNPPPRLPFELRGPGLTQTESSISVPEGVTQVPCAQAREPGNYQVFDRGGNPIAGFSVSIRPSEFSLQKIDQEAIKTDLPSIILTNGLKAFSPDSLLPPSEGGTLDLLPWLMMGVIGLLLCESVLANRFHRKVPEAEGSGFAEVQAPPAVVSASPSPG